MWNPGGWKFFFVSVAVAALVAAAMAPERRPEAERPAALAGDAERARLLAVLDALREERAATERRIPWLLDQHRAEAEATLAEIERRIAEVSRRLERSDARALPAAPGGGRAR
jgi:hypothetical protein